MKRDIPSCSLASALDGAAGYDLRSGSVVWVSGSQTAS